MMLSSIGTNVEQSGWISYAELALGSIQGLSTRAVDDLVRAMGLTDPSKSQVSRLCEDIDERVQAFVNYPLQGDGPFLWLAATSVKASQGRADRFHGDDRGCRGQHRRAAREPGITVMPSEAKMRLGPTFCGLLCAPAVCGACSW
jgi:hypothetical protein